MSTYSNFKLAAKTLSIPVLIALSNCSGQVSCPGPQAVAFPTNQPGSLKFLIVTAPKEELTSPPVSLRALPDCSPEDEPGYTATAIHNTILHEGTDRACIYKVESGVAASTTGQGYIGDPPAPRTSPYSYRSGSYVGSIGSAVGSMIGGPIVDTSVRSGGIAAASTSYPQLTQ